MYKSVSFNIYKEHLENIVFAERENGNKNDAAKESEDKPIPKPPPPDWTDSGNYRSFNRESESTNSN